jgi:hypothetical protein
MDIESGLYRVTFGTPMGGGNGVAHLADGKLHGGDSMMAYVGSYSVDGGNFTANVHAFRHSNVPGMVSTLGTNDAQLSIKGTVQGTTMTGQGNSPQAPGVTLQVKLEKLQG